MRMVKAVMAGAMVAMLGVVAGAASASRTPAPESSVAFVNIGKVLQEYPAAKALVDSLKADHDKLRDNITTRMNELRDQEQDLDARVSPNSQEYRRERRKLQMLAQELKYDEKDWRADIQRRQVKGMADLYLEITAEAARIAEESGYTAVLQAEIDPIDVEDEDGNLINYTDLRLQMAMRTVIWNADGVDITQAVIESLKDE